MVAGIVGVGFVGGALEKWFRNFTDHKLKLYDPRLGYKDSLKDCDVCFISVPVPTKENGTQAYSFLEDALSKCSKNTLIRSTVLPGTNDKYGTHSCPEFLSERTAYEDVCNMGILTGHPDREFIREIFPQKFIIQTSNVEAELAKYAHNAFGAVKVNFFNLIYKICKTNNASYENVMRGVLLSGYINETHTMVPGADGKFGFGGTCFPKDLAAFNKKFPTATFASCLLENANHRFTDEQEYEQSRGKPTKEPGALSQLK